MQGFHSFFSEGAVAAANGAARAQEGNADGGGAWRRCAAALDGQEALAAEDHQTRLLQVLCVQEFALDADHSAAALLSIWADEGTRTRGSWPGSADPAVGSSSRPI